MISLIRYGPAVFAMILVAQTWAAEPDSTSADPDTTSGTLSEFDNGLQLLVLPRPDEKLVQVDVYLSLRGAALNAGMAHLVEHLMFTSTEHCPQGSVRDSLQLLTTYLQGLTNTRNVHTITRCLPEHLPRLLAVEAERYGRLKPDVADLQHERERVLGEQEFRNEASAGQALSLRVIAMAFQEDGEASNPIVGSREVIGAVGLADVDTFVTRWMRMDRTVVMVSGPVDPLSVVAQAKQTFGELDGPSGELELGELSPPPEARSIVTRSNDQSDLLVVGFRLPYGTPEEAAIAHLTETIMDRENGNPDLILFEDEALLTLHVPAWWSRHISDEAAATKSIEQFWKETRTVIRRVGDDWVFKRNRQAHVEGFVERMKEPFQRTTWRAQRLADDRDLPTPEVLAAMIDSLSGERVQEYFAEQFTQDRAYTAFAKGRAPRDNFLSSWNRGLRFSTNPYLVPQVGSVGLGREEIDPILSIAAAGDIGNTETVTLKNGIPVLILPLADPSWVFLGGVRSYPSLEDESPSRHPGRLRLYSILVNSGYDRKGGTIWPYGQDLEFGTQVDSRVASLRITALGEASEFEDVVATIHKRVKVDRFNPYGFDWLVKNRQEWFKKGFDAPPVLAEAWLMEKVFGPDAPQVGWWRANLDEIEKWSFGKAKKMHRNLFRTGNLQLVVAGPVDSVTVKNTMDRYFGERPKPEPGWFPAASRADLAVEGAVIHDGTSDVATLEWYFPTRALAAEPKLGQLDLMVVARLVESRMRIAARDAGVDSVTIHAGVAPAGAAALPLLWAVCLPADATTVLSTVGEVLEDLLLSPPTRDEEARARLQVVGPLLENLLSGSDGRDLLLEMGQFGPIPADLLGEIQQREYGVVTAPEAVIFRHDRYAWTATVDSSLVAPSEFGNPRPGDPGAKVIEMEID